MEVDNKTLQKYLAEVRRVEKSRSEGAEKEIRKLYKGLLKDLIGFVGEYYTKYSNDEGVLSAAILQQKAKYAAFLEEVDRNINDITPEVSKTIKKTVEDTYKACYKGMVNAFTGAVDDEKVKESFKGLSIKPEVIKAAVENPISGLTLPERLKKNRQEVIYDIKQNITTALMTGERYDTTAKKIAERLDISYGKAVRIVRTESHRVEEKGLMDGAEQVGEKVKGDGLVYAVIWRNMGDGKVRPYSRVHTSKGWKTVKSKTHADHVKMEGQIIEAGGYFDLGHGVKAKSPGESGDAANDINCRCFIEYEMMTEEEFIERGGKFKESRRKAEKNIEKFAENDIIKLTDEEVGAVNRYISSESYTLNDKLRNGVELTKNEQKLVKNLSSALNKLPKYKGDLNRSVNFDNDEKLATFLEEHKVGDIVTYKEFISTTKGEEYAPEFNVQIHINNSKKGTNISMLNESESEILYNINSKFKVLNVILREGIYHIVLSEVN